MRADVVIIGAGAAGIAAAYYLTKQGAKPLVIERDAIGSHASGFALGGLSPFSGYGIPGPVYPLAREGMRLHIQLARELRESTGVDTHFRLTDVLSLATDEEEERGLAALLPWLDSENFPARWIGIEELQQIERRFSSHLRGALQIDGVGVLEAYRFCLSLAQAAEQGGTTIRQGQVKTVHFDGGRVTAVETESEVIPTERVLLAAGPWTGAFDQSTGTRVPVRPLKGQIVRLRVDNGSNIPYFSWRGNYAIAKSDGLLWAGTTKEEVGFDERITVEARDSILASLATVFPPIMDAEIVQQTACLRPLSADGLPILGPVPEREGVYVATGAGRKGILLSPAMGKIAADLILTGTTKLDISAMLPERFAQGRSGAGVSPRPHPVVD